MKKSKINTYGDDEDDDEEEEEDGEKNSKTRIIINEIKDEERMNERKNGPFNSFHFIASSFACSRSVCDCE